MDDAKPVARSLPLQVVEVIGDPIFGMLMRSDGVKSEDLARSVLPIVAHLRRRTAAGLPVV
jgi:hypothetical protein